MFSLLLAIIMIKFEVDNCNHLTIMVLAEDVIFIVFKNASANYSVTNIVR